MQDKFQEEMYGRKTLETDRGYLLYSVFDDGSLYIHQAYVKPEFRNKGAVTKMERQLIEKYGIKLLACYVDCTSRNPEQSLLSILQAGYKINRINENSIELFKEVR